MRRFYHILILSSSLALYVTADGFVDEVSCSSDALTVVLNVSDPDLALWLQDPKAQPVAYVHGHKTRLPCGTSIKSEQGTNLKLQIPYGKECDVMLSNLEPNFIAAETTIALEDNADGNINKHFRINHVYCLYTKSVKTIKYSDVSTGHEIVASTGGRPKPKVEMLFRSTDGNALRAAKLGDTIEFYVALIPDQAYRGITPKECMFSDREDTASPEAKHITFVQNSCPVNDMTELIDPLQNVNQEVYFSKFHTFRFGNQSTVFAHCTVQVCLKAEDCEQGCFKRVLNSTLNANRLRMRHRRETEKRLPYSKQDLYNEINLTKTLTILDEGESRQVAARSTEECIMSPTTAPSSLLALVAVLSLLSVLSAAGLIFMLLKHKKNHKDSFDVYSAFGNASLSTSSRSLGALPISGIMDGGYQSSSYGNRAHPFVHHMSNGDGTYR